MELAKWTFPIIVSFSREPYEVESLTYGSNGGHEETYRKATRLVPTQWRRTVRQRALCLPSRGGRKLIKGRSCTCLGIIELSDPFRRWRSNRCLAKLLLCYRLP